MRNFDRAILSSLRRLPSGRSSSASELALSGGRDGYLPEFLLHSLEFTRLISVGTLRKSSNFLLN